VFLFTVHGDITQLHVIVAHEQYLPGSSGILLLWPILSWSIFCKIVISYKTMKICKFKG